MHQRDAFAEVSGKTQRAVLKSVQAQYHGCLAKAAPFCGDPESTHAKHFEAVTGEAMALLAVLSECLPEHFLACLSMNMLDGSTQMPQQAFESLKVATVLCHWIPLLHLLLLSDFVQLKPTEIFLRISCILWLHAKVIIMERRLDDHGQDDYSWARGHG